MQDNIHGRAWLRKEAQKANWLCRGSSLTLEEFSRGFERRNRDPMLHWCVKSHILVSWSEVWTCRERAARVCVWMALEVCRLVYQKSRGRIFSVDRRVSSLDTSVLHAEVHPLSHPHKQARLNHTFIKRENSLVTHFIIKDLLTLFNVLKG